MTENKESLATKEAGLEGAQEAASERSRELLLSPDKSTERSKDTESALSIERSRVEALFSKEQSAGESKKARMDGSGHSSKKQTPTPASSLDRDRSYKQTLSHIEAEMNASQRAFSKIIHTPSIEKASEAIGSTVARPNAILAGSFTAFVTITLVYVVARNMGYALSGFETIAAFLIGWSLGLIYDYLRILIGSR